MIEYVIKHPAANGPLMHTNVHVRAQTQRLEHLVGKLSVLQGYVICILVQHQKEFVQHRLSGLPQ
jgi:hypothetical protein